MKVTKINEQAAITSMIIWEEITKRLCKGMIGDIYVTRALRVGLPKMRIEVLQEIAPALDHAWGLVRSYYLFDYETCFVPDYLDAINIKKNEVGKINISKTESEVFAWKALAGAGGKVGSNDCLDNELRDTINFTIEQTGSTNGVENFFYLEQNLNLDDVKRAVDFLDWTNRESKNISSDNIELIYAEYYAKTKAA